MAHDAFRRAASDPYVLAVYGAVMDAAGNGPLSLKAFAKLTELEPGVAAHWMNRATASRRTGDWTGALACYERAGALGASGGDYHYNKGLLLLDLLRYDEARLELQAAAALAPLDAEIQYQYARSCFACVETDEMQAALKSWRQWSGVTPAMAASIASLLLQAGEQEDAGALLERLMVLPSLIPDLELQVIGMLERLNRVDEASARLQSMGVIDSRSEVYPAWLVVSAQIESRRGRHDIACKHYAELLSRVAALEDQQAFLFPMAKSLDALGRHDEAMECISRAHASQMRHIERTGIGIADADRPVMAITQYGCDETDVRGWSEPAPPDAQASPIFIVAFPRSGTTLLEQMLDAHPRLVTMDEQPILQKAVTHIESLGFVYPENLAPMTPDDLALVRARYWQEVAKKVRLEPGQRLIDKNPLNMLRLPAIRRLFPRAKILLSVRHPCDVITSNYFQHYRAPEFVRLCKDLDTLALAYRKAFDFWYAQQAILAADVMEVRYESFVTDFERSARSIAAFLELDWNDSMLEPWRHASRKGYISTPSYSQVVLPVNTRAVGRWRRYEAQLMPVVGELSSYLERWNYLEDIRTEDRC